MHRNTDLEHNSEASEKSGRILSFTALVLELTASTMKTFRMRARAKRRRRRRRRNRSSIAEKSGTFKSTKIKTKVGSKCYSDMVKSITNVIKRIKLKR